MTNQDYINQALAYGIPQSAIDSFLQGNPGDYSRLLSALGPDYAPATYNTVTSSNPIAVPTPVASPVGSSTTASANDGTITGSMSLGTAGLAGAAAPLSLVKGNATNSGGSPITINAGGGFSVSPWMLIAAAVLVFFFLKD